MLITEQTFKKSLDVISQCEELAIDCETFWVDQWHLKRIMGVAVYCKLEEKTLAAYYPFRHKHKAHIPGSGINLPWDCFEPLVETLNHDSAVHIFHNAPFDRSRFELEHQFLTRPFLDTLVMSHMVQEYGSHELEDLAEEHEIDSHANARQRRLHAMRDVVGWEYIPVEDMAKYACGDVHNTYMLKRLMSMKLKQQEMYHLLNDDMEFNDELTRMMSRGIVLNTDMATRLSVQASERMEAIKKELGFDPMKPLPLATKLFKELKLPCKLRGKPTKQFPSGRPTMNEKVLAKFKHPVAELVLEYRGLVKAKGTWYDGFNKFVDNHSRIHPGFNQAGTRTSRLSCNKPNVQQLPRDVANTPVKKMLEAPPGFVLVQFDYSQLEYREAAVYSGDSAIIGAYLEGSDFHNLTAERMGITRQDGKTLNYALLFGAQHMKIAELMGVSPNDGKDILAQLKSYYPSVFALSDRVSASAKRRGYVKLWTGRRCHFLYHWEAQRLGFNTLIQGGGAEITKHGILNVRRTRTNPECYLVSQIHDAVWAEIPKESLEEEVERIKYALEWPSRDPKWKIPFPVDIDILSK